MARSRMPAGAQADADAVGGIDWLVSVDSTIASAARMGILESSSMHPHEPIEVLAYGGVVSMKSEPIYLTGTAGEVTAAAGHAWRVVAVDQDSAQSVVREESAGEGDS